MKNKIIDCVTFFNENFIFELRYNILKYFVDYFVICESKYDHKGNKKELNFDINKYLDNKIKYIVLEEPFSSKNDEWENQAIQRDFILKNINFVDDEDYIFFSDPDEIPNTDLLKNFYLNNKYGIFQQKSFNYKFNLFNKHETPWDGTRVCKKKNLKSINYMRQNVLTKNLKYKFYRIDKERDIQVFANGGWHFNNIMTPEEISLKLKTFAHSEYSDDIYSSPEIINKKINEKKDLFNRGYEYHKIELDNSFPRYLIENKELYKKFII